MGLFTNGLSIAILVAFMVSTAYAGGNFRDVFEPTFGDNRVQTYGRGGELLSLTLDKVSGCGFRSKKEYLNGRFDMQMKLVPNNSAGTVTTFYLSSEGSAHDEIDFEFLGNETGKPYTMHTNVFSQGLGNREQQFQLWFDPTKNFHTYSIVWNPKHIMFLVDNVAVRVFQNSEDLGVPYLKNQPMRVYASLWNADDWATQGGLVKTNWSQGPFKAYYRNFNIDACEGTAGSSCVYAPETTTTDASRNQPSSAPMKPSNGSWRTHELDANGRKRLRYVQDKHMVYDYCRDHKRFSKGFPVECKRSRV